MASRDRELGDVLDPEQAVRVIEASQSAWHESMVNELRNAVEVVVKSTSGIYTRENDLYSRVRQASGWSWDGYLYATLLALVRSRISDRRLHHPGARWRLLDVGAGDGRDTARFGKEPDVEPVALDNSAGFLRVLRELQSSGALGPGGVVSADMRDLAVIPDASYACVRCNAALHHLPVVPAGLGADAAVAEARRVLVAGGIYCVLVKAGAGVGFIDTGEELSGRFYQLFTRCQLAGLLERHAFEVVHLEGNTEHRPSGDIPWLFALAVAI